MIAVNAQGNKAKLDRRRLRRGIGPQFRGHRLAHLGNRRGGELRFNPHGEPLQHGRDRGAVDGVLRGEAENGADLGEHVEARGRQARAGFGGGGMRGRGCGERRAHEECGEREKQSEAGHGLVFQDEQV